MSDLFQVGQEYCNRLGEFTVLEVSGDELSIRYQDGTEMTVDRELQSRIVHNMQFEKTVAAQLRQTRTRTQGRHSLVPSSWGRDWHGLLETDFQDSSSGTHWRNRGELGGAVASELSEKISQRFESYACYRQSECHYYDPERYDSDLRERQAKFVVDLCDDSAKIGFYIEHDDTELDESWDWGRLRAALQTNAELSHRVEQAMRRHNLSWSVYDEDGAEPVASVVLGQEVGQLLLVQGDESNAMTWDELPAQLDDLDDDWRKLYLSKDVPREDALAMSTNFSAHATAIMADLMPLYQASTSA